MTVDERRRLEMFERLREVLGHDVAETLLAHLPPPGERVTTVRQLERLESRFDQRFDDMRAEMHHLFELQEARLAARWRRDLLLLAVPQFLVLLGVVVSLNV